jgi:membrane-associated PAP2 superfamily phosphatase
LTYRRFWLPEIIGLVVVALLATIPFWWSSLDLTIAEWFYHPDQSDPWLESKQGLWQFFYVVVPWMSVIFGLMGLSILAIGIIRHGSTRYRVYGLFLFLSVVLGPGLVVNVVFKDYWERPRPRDVQMFGGEQNYVPPLMLGSSGNSFPCGHCSVAFACGAFYLICRRRRPAWAWSALIGSTVLGLSVGTARIVAGGHFLSDVLWSGVLTWTVLLLLYWPIMRIPWREDYPELYLSLPDRNVITFFKLTLIGIAAAGLLYFAWLLY